MRKWYPIILIALAILVSAISYPRLPDQVPTHWDIHGNVNDYSSKTLGLFLLPVLMFGIWALMRALPLIDPRHENYAKMRGAYELVFNATLTLLLLVHVVAIGAMLGLPVSITRVIPALVGALFVVIGNMMPLVRPNWWFGIRTPWTLANDRVWARTHRLAGYCMTAGGVVIIVAALALPPQFGFPILLVAALASTFGLGALLVSSPGNRKPPSRKVRMKRIASIAVAPRFRPSRGERAQAPLAAPDRYSFYLVVGADTILDRARVAHADELHGEFLDQRRGARLQYLAALTANGSIPPSRRAATARPPTRARSRRSTSTAASVAAELGNGQRARIPGAPGLDADRQSVDGPHRADHAATQGDDAGHEDDAACAPRRHGTADDGDGHAAPAPTRRRSTIANVVDASARSRAEGHVLGGSRARAAPQHSARARPGDPLVAQRKDYSAPPGAPYTAEDVMVRTPAGMRFSGTLTLPVAAHAGACPLS